MLRFLAVFTVLFLGAVAGISLLPNPPKIAGAHSAVAAQLQADAAPAANHPDVRVVYPASGTEAQPIAANVPVQTSSAVASSLPAGNGAATTAVTESVYPQVRTAAPGADAPMAPADAAVQAGTQNINLNTASVEALNQIPGAGHIGRTIASHRPYRSVEDLLTKRVVRKSVYERIKAQVAAE